MGESREQFEGLAMPGRRGNLGRRLEVKPLLPKEGRNPTVVLTCRMR